MLPVAASRGVVSQIPNNCLERDLDVRTLTIDVQAESSCADDAVITQAGYYIRIGWLIQSRYSRFVSFETDSYQADIVGTIRSCRQVRSRLGDTEFNLFHDRTTEADSVPEEGAVVSTIVAESCAEE